MSKKEIGKVLMKGSLVTFLTGFFMVAQYDAHKERRYVITPKKGMFTAMADVSDKIDMERLQYQNAYLVKTSKHDMDSNKDILGGFVVEEDILYTTQAGCSSPDQKPIPQNPNHPIEKEDWGSERIHADAAAEITDSKDVLICSIDTGMDINHKDLEGVYVAGVNFTNEGSRDNVHDRVGHGTHTIGTMAARRGNEIGIAGVSKSKVAVCKGLGEQGGYSSWIADCVSWCDRQGAKVINMSLGSKDSSTVIYNAIKAYTDSGGIVVAAAGNDSSNVGFPAAYSNVISVSATNRRDQLAVFSNRGKINYAAPGVDIMSTIPGGNYQLMSGTSMAAPHVTAVIALALSEGKSTLQTDMIGPPEFYGLGLVNALKSVQ